MPFLFPALYSYALLRRRLAYENIFCLFYRFLLYTHIFPVGSKIFNNIYSDLFALYLFAAILILVIGPVDHPNREVDAQENRTFIKRTYFTMLISFFLALFFIFTQNTRYMFLQAIVFVFISATSLIGRLIYKQT